MKWLLMQAGWTAYQASCLAPWLWFLVVAGIVTGAVTLIGAIEEDTDGDDVVSD